MPEQKNSPNKSNGPVFEAGPGWGEKTKNWMSKYFYKVVLPAIVVVLVAYGIISRNGSPEISSPEITNEPILQSASISQVIKAGEGKINVARRAVEEFAKLNTEEALSAGEKVFLETTLAQDVSASAFKAGQTIEFGIDAIRDAISKFKTLSASQIQKWDYYARRAGIK